MEVCGTALKYRQKVQSLRIDDGVDGRMTPCRCDTGLDLLDILEVAAVREADRKMKPLGLLEEVLVVGIRVNPPKDRIPRLTGTAVRTWNGTDRTDVTRPSALPETGLVTRDDRKCGLVDATRLSVTEPNM